MAVREFQVDRSDLTDFGWRDAPDSDVSDGEVELHTVKFGLTANNLSYARNGERMGYWRFFPSATNGKGLIPVWGIASVRRSRVDGITEGETVYGFLPIKRNFKVRVSEVGSDSFVDVSDHRPNQAKVYNIYRRISRNPGLAEDASLLFTPLFGTAFLFSDYLRRQSAGLGASTIIILSASSKTAMATAYLLKRHAVGLIVGVTSSSNFQLLRAASVHDVLLRYEDVGEAGGFGPSIVVDLSGSGTTIDGIIDALGHNLRLGCKLGTTNWRDAVSVAALRSKGWVTFFAPDQYSHSVRQRGGQAAYDREYQQQFGEYLRAVRRFMSTSRFSSEDGVVACYQQLLDGGFPPTIGPLIYLDP